MGHPALKIDQPAAAPPMPLDMTVQPNDDVSAVILRLLAAQGLVVSVVGTRTDDGEMVVMLDARLARTVDDVPVRLPRSDVVRLVAAVNQPRPIEAAFAIAPAFAPRRPAEADGNHTVTAIDAQRDPGDESDWAPRLAGDLVAAGDVETAAMARPVATGIELDVELAAEDAVFRPQAAPSPTAEHLEAMRVANVLAANPKLAKVVKHLIRPLVMKRLEIDGDPEVVLLRIAEEFGAYTRDQLDCAAQHLLTGRHRKMPDRQEIAAALGICAKPAA